MTAPYVRLQRRGGYWRGVWDEAGRSRSVGLGSVRKVAEREAMRRCGEIEREMRTTGRVYDRRSAPTLRAWCREYLSIRSDISEKTYRIYETSIAFMESMFGASTRIDRIDRLAAERWRSALRSTGLADNTVRKHLRSASAIFGKAVEVGLTRSNPFAGIPSAPVRVEGRGRTITEDEMRLVLDACPDGRWRCAFGLAYYAGLRFGEIQRLRWSDIAFGSHRLTVSNTGRTAGTKRRERVVKMEGALERLLTEEFHAGGADGPCQGLGEAQHAANKIISRSGVAPWPKPFHTLRATRARVWKARYPEFVVDAWLGHSLAVSREHYMAVPEDYYCPPKSNESDALAAALSELTILRAQLRAQSVSSGDGASSKPL